MNGISLTKRCMIDGAKAYMEGKKISENPYRNAPHSQSYRRWNRGFETQRERNILPELVETAPKKTAARKATATKTPKVEASVSEKPVKKTASKKAVAAKTVSPKPRAVRKKAE